MAGARAATSVSLTFGVALATLLVVAGILAGPAILDCTHQGGGLGACLRGKAVDSGLLPERDVPAEVPILTSSIAPELPTIAEAPHKTGWIEANATEYERMPPDAARLQAPDGTLDAGGAAGAPSPAVEVALVEPGGRIAARGAARPAADFAARSDLLGDPGGGLHATGTAVAVIDPASTTLTLAAGIVSATGGEGAAAGPTIGATIAAPRGTPILTGSIGRASSRSASALLEASLVPIVPSLMPPPLAPPLVEAAPSAPVPLAPQAAPVRKPMAKAKAPAKPHRPRPPAIRYDPHYPNVLVLPPPNVGEDSSFATLEVR